MSRSLWAGGLALLLLASSARAEVSGVVWVDANGDGQRQAEEPPAPGVVVTNGRAVTRSAADGRYQLPDAGRFVYLTRPAGYACAEWYREGGGDFALQPQARQPDSFFVQISDSHVYERRADFAEFSSLTFPWFVPQFVVDWLTLWFLERNYGDDVADRLRAALAPYRDDVAELSDVAAFRAYSEERARPESSLGEVAEPTRAAFREVAGLRPEFVIATGDLVLESNRGSPEAIERWFGFYRELSGSLGVPVYNTIGNNEIAGIENDAFPDSDPRYGRHFFHAFLGPSHYSFDRGRFHFVALDTHRPLDDEEGWTFGRMPDAVRDWLDADLAAHPGLVPVVLNHEPFHFDPAWPFSPDPTQTADDEGLFAKHGVLYALSGHTHYRSFLRRDGVVHLTTGALSGLRWVLPASVHERGYRLFYARDGELHSAWKRTGEPVVGWSEGAERDADRVAVVADRDGPFASIEVTRNGAALAVERWGEYFVRVPGVGAAHVSGVREDASRFEAELVP